jgi:TPR repeat protein
MYLLGRAYKDGRGVEKSRETALDWFRKGAAAGHRGAADEARKLEQT